MTGSLQYVTATRNPPKGTVSKTDNWPTEKARIQADNRLGEGENGVK